MTLNKEQEMYRAPVSRTFRNLCPVFEIFLSVGSFLCFDIEGIEKTSSPDEY